MTSGHKGVVFYVCTSGYADDGDECSVFVSQVMVCVCERVGGGVVTR